MANFDAKNIRNVVILGHQSTGKTTLVESLAFIAGLIPQKVKLKRRTLFLTTQLMNKKEVVPFKPQSSH